MRILAIAVAVALLAAAASCAHAAYFRLDSAKPICFVEEVSYGGELIIFQYTRKMFQSTSSQMVLLTVTSPLTKSIVAKRQLKEASQILTFSPLATEIGEYEICLVNPLADSPFGSQEGGRGIEIEILIDHQDRRVPLSSASNHAAPALRHKVQGDDEVFVFTDADGQAKEALRTHDYLDRVTHSLDVIDRVIEETIQEVTYFKQRQDRMRVTSESSFSRVWSFSVLSISMVVAVSFVQFFSLRSFLKAKKLV